MDKRNKLIIFLIVLIGVFVVLDLLVMVYERNKETESLATVENNKKSNDAGFVCSEDKNWLPIGDSCFKKLNNFCTILHESQKDHDKAVDVVIIGADYVPGVFFLDSCYYSDKFDSLFKDALAAVNGFLSYEVYRDHKDIFNFYLLDYATIPCVGASKIGRCESWDEFADYCGIDYDAAVILVNNCYEEILPLSVAKEDIPSTLTFTRQGVASGKYIEVFQSIGIFIHELSHLLGLADEYAYTVNGPNIYKTLESCGKPLCKDVGEVECYSTGESAEQQIANGLCNLHYIDPKTQEACCYEYKFTEQEGGTCCYPLESQYNKPQLSGYYATNEISIMKDSLSNRFSQAAREALESNLSEIESKGFHTWQTGQ